jgi:hypothetical protein
VIVPTIDRQTSRRVAAIRAVKSLHTLVFLAMSVAVLYVLYSGVSGSRHELLWAAIALIVLEGAVFAAAGFRCPLTTLARGLGDETGHDYVADYLVPPAAVRFTVPVCGALFLLGVVLLLVSAVVPP